MRHVLLQFDILAAGSVVSCLREYCRFHFLAHFFDPTDIFLYLFIGSLFLFAESVMFIHLLI